MDAAGRSARLLASLGWWVTGAATLLALAMGVLIVWGSLRRRGTLDEHLPPDTRGGTAWILIGGLAVPLAVLTTFFVMTMSALRALPTTVENPDLTLHVTARQWWWQADYAAARPADRFTVANELHVPVGARVQVVLDSLDVIHSFWVPKLFGKTDAIPGHTNRFVFEAERPGVYRGECAEFCGVQHASMRFTVVAEPPADYAAWAAAQRKPALAPTDPELITGRDAFEQQACALCHTVRGTHAHGGTAPDLTHFGSRMTIGAGRLPNDPAQLTAWIIDAQSFKPGAEMPALGATLDGSSLVALTRYLESLD
jgi:cytochrome c oxidase subunit 2